MSEIERRQAPSKVGRKKVLSLLQAEADKLATTPDALALAWVLSQSWVGMCLSGAATSEHVFVPGMDFTDPDFCFRIRGK